MDRSAEPLADRLDDALSVGDAQLREERPAEQRFAIIVTDDGVVALRRPGETEVVRPGTDVLAPHNERGGLDPPITVVPKEG